MSERIAECFIHIATCWKAEYYKNSFEEWENIKLFIVKDNLIMTKNYSCSGCATRWTSKRFINEGECVCPACDNWCQPFLCNPINKEYVKKFIPKEYHKFILVE